MAINEKEVIANAQQDPEAFGQLYDEYYKPIFGFMYSRTGNNEVAKDLTSETFFQALKNLHRFKYREGISIKSWLFAIAVSQIGNYFRQRAKVFEVTIDEAPEIIERDEFRPDVAFQIGEDVEEVRNKIVQLRRVMKQLNQKQQDIITLRFFSKMTIPDIAATMKMKEGTIKSHIHRAIKKMSVLMIQESNAIQESNESTKSAQNVYVFHSEPNRRNA
ncbi:sigma-70 family RNA polymerase sigma factor [Candidatus Uhrbacteria bacterium]|nr:sigma-70 family RNA polymerase sigma factor [Candidatus Uhrbacteria bacterium]